MLLAQQKSEVVSWTPSRTRTSRWALSQLARDNHFLPQSYLRGWSDDSLTVAAYRTLVADERMPQWQQRSIARFGYRRDLYTVAIAGREVDDFERWIATTFEEPAAPVLERVRQDQSLSVEDWERLAAFFAAQDVRTPTTYMEFVSRWKRELPAMMEDVLASALQEFAVAGGSPAPSQAKPPDEFQSAVRVKMAPDEADPEKAWIGLEVTAGRSLWVSSMRQLLTGPGMDVLKGLSWSIAHPAKGTEWFTSDHPALRLNFNSKDDFNFNGGWGQLGTDLILPLSPRHLLYATVGKPRAGRLQLTTDQTMAIQRALALRAHRWIVARREMSRVRWWRKREVDATEFAREEAEWADWHPQQTRAELGDGDSGDPVSS